MKEPIRRLIRNRSARLTAAVYLCLGGFLLAACDSDEAEKQTPLPQVRTAPLSELQTAIDYSAPAQALSKNDALIAAELSSTVRAVVSDVGARVSRGETLVRLDCRDAEDALAQAEATLASLRARESLAEQQYERARALRKSDSVSEEELNQKETSLEAARADRRAQAAQQKLARRNVERCSVAAPFDGVVTEKRTQAGERVAPGTPLVRLVDTDNLEVQAQVGADEAERLTPDSRPYFVTDEQRYPLELRSVAGAVDARTLSQAVRLDFPGPAPKPGTLGSLVWTDARAALPPHLISERDGRLGVLLAEDDQVVFHPLPGALPGRSAFVDLPPDTPVITDGRRGLKAGERFVIDNR